MLGGFLCVNKPPGMSSHDVVAWTRRLLRIKKVGHTGTLDPAASGVLVLAIGEATKVLEFMESETKEYRVECVLGIETDTQDGTGKITRVTPCQVTEEEIEDVLQEFVGVISQVPPMVSAVKHQGRRLYELARQGIEVERRPRKVTIERLTLVPLCSDGKLVSMEKCDLHTVTQSFAPENQLEAGPVFGSAVRFMFDVKCSRGTYVRTLCADIGKRLGCGGYMSFLLRTRSGPFALSQAMTLESIEAEITAGKPLSDIAFPIAYGIPHIPQIQVSDKQRVRLSNGNRITLRGQQLAKDTSWVLVVDREHVEVCIARVERTGSAVEIQPTKVFV